MPAGRLQHCSLGETPPISGPRLRGVETNVLYYGDNLDIVRRYIPSRRAAGHCVRHRASPSASGAPGTRSRTRTIQAGGGCPPPRGPDPGSVVRAWCGPGLPTHDRWHLRREMRGVPCRVQHDRCHGLDRDAAATGSSVPVVMTGQVFVHDRRPGTTETRSVSSGGRQANSRLRLPVDLRRRPVRRLLVSGRPTSWRATPTAHPGHLRARPEAGHDETRERVERREAGDPGDAANPLDLGRRPHRRLLLLFHQPGRARYERTVRTCLRARPAPVGEVRGRHRPTTARARRHRDTGPLSAQHPRAVPPRR